MKTLGIETSCDETAVAVYDSEHGIIGESVFSQIKMHAEYGGVVPELASRDHCVKIISVLQEAINQVDLQYIDQVAYTSGPGLLGALLIGESFAQGISSALNIPLIPINHLEGHLMSPVMEFPEIKVPYICLLVSGGHSMIVDVKDRGDYKILGQSQDDAVGEAFDKVGKLLGLPYPGGPHIERLALKGNSKAYDFPRPMMHSDNLDLSFSGLKTSVLYTVRDIDDLTDQVKADIAASFQQAVIDVLTKKIKKAVELSGRSEVIIAGGVAANKALRAAIKDLENTINIKVYYPSLKYCGDNAAMIAFVGSLRSSDKINISGSSVRARWPLSELTK
ncbi:tRNA (adenosine(37)-N6)-threonylcarbamoyltransferase complex transferase subunit TsaD [Gammaproteobacteria bacterium]|nr:tRNA (adenosine(37)-N6)-threonylcarbamoyltransferase complex transferase subunit TsaD [Gammaproteobacteria bacterium]MDA7695869.1 tRNA (adenosine(37)-N6)-threonylcarbamoyltransferase complex transferase subunit TsaD [Gammaproteobacteria bacterium]MDA7710347.1 tRNA (adenosine(37)-N6)-threonylcarbamoyltransferase complex transferase subunit TsaD [Gammaproteobacteria bacterium]MDA7734737.1 tRNA (adenosine(37)-N6)-threonylcarbamoyltransferase complex transferase subunit TsaD [Gammaproteobacteria |tara:strand:- start:320 stop:1324 length:1005 start_codon:yes stop_codon:yes gene_type:complete